jgi:hypothetical protein
MLIRGALVRDLTSVNWRLGREYWHVLCLSLWWNGLPDTGHRNGFNLGRN